MPNHFTAKLVSFVVDSPPLEAVTVIGYVPVAGLEPTFQVQETFPPLSAVLEPRPVAVLGPELYSTSIEHSAPGTVLAFSVADDP